MLTIITHKLRTRINFDQLLDDLMSLIRGCLVHEWFDPQSATQLLHKVASSRDLGEGNRQASTNRAWKHMEDLITKKLRIVLAMDLDTLQRFANAFIANKFWMNGVDFVQVTEIAIILFKN